MLDQQVHMYLYSSGAVQVVDLLGFAQLHYIPEPGEQFLVLGETSIAAAIPTPPVAHASCQLLGYKERARSSRASLPASQHGRGSVPHPPSFKGGKNSTYLPRCVPRAGALLSGDSFFAPLRAYGDWSFSSCGDELGVLSMKDLGRGAEIEFSG